jgi:hypothetical protein
MGGFGVLARGVGEFSEAFEGIDAGVVAVGEGNGVGVDADGGQTGDGGMRNADFVGGGEMSKMLLETTLAARADCDEGEIIWRS